tara:strand:- start:2446 stop:2823 length:378 start_codon:yes stop_codon:yes gene_type:complete
MNFILRILIIGISSFYFSDIFPWWIIILIPFTLGCLIDDNYFSHFLSGFIGTSVAWFFILLNIEFESQSILSLKVIEILEIGSINTLIILTVIIGGVFSGLGIITGYSLRNILTKKKNFREYRFN